MCSQTPQTPALCRPLGRLLLRSIYPRNTQINFSAHKLISIFCDLAFQVALQSCQGLPQVDN